jgi:tetratricopeptide (TPR) repeat protein
LAVAYSYSGDLPAALGHGQMAYAYFYRLGDSLGMGRAMYSLSQAYRLIRRFEQAKRTLELAKTHYSETDNPRQYAGLAYAEGLLLLNCGEYESARQWLELAVKEARTLEHPHYLAKHLYGLGLAEIYLESFDSARKHLRAALAIWLKEKNLYEEANVNYALGFLEYKSGNARNACAFYQQALQLCRAISNIKAGESLARSIQKDMARLDSLCD